MNNLLPIALLIAEMGNVGDKVGRLKGAARFGALASLYDEALALTSVDFSLVDDEWKACLADPAKMEELRTKVNAKFDIADDKLELLIEDGILLVKKHYDLVIEDMAFIERFKNA